MGLSSGRRGQLQQGGDDVSGSRDNGDASMHDLGSMFRELALMHSLEVAKLLHRLLSVRTQDVGRGSKHATRAPQTAGPEAPQRAHVELQQLTISSLMEAEDAPQSSTDKLAGTPALLVPEMEHSELQQRVDGASARSGVLSKQDSDDNETEVAQDLSSARGTQGGYVSAMGELERSDKTARHMNQIATIKRLLNGASAPSCMQSAEDGGTVAEDEVARLQNLLAASTVFNGLVRGKLLELRPQKQDAGRGRKEQRATEMEPLQATDSIGGSSAAAPAAVAAQTPGQGSNAGGTGDRAPDAAHVEVGTSGILCSSGSGEDLELGEAWSVEVESLSLQLREGRVSRKASAELHSRMLLQLAQQLAVSRLAVKTAQEEIAGLRRGMADGEAQHAAELELIQQQVALAELKNLDEQEGMEASLGARRAQFFRDELMERYCLAVETKRFAERRLLDLKSQMAMLETRHASKMPDVNKRPPAAPGLSETDADRGRASEPLGGPSSLRSRGQGLERRIWQEERDRVMSTPEGKGRQQKGQSDDEESRRAAEVAQLKKRYDNDLQQLRTQIQELTAQQPFLSRLGCPSRLMGPPSSGSEEVAHCQTVCWQVLTLVPGIVAMHCHCPSLRILEVNAGASVMWGCTSLVGKSFVSLLSDQTEAAMLSTVCAMHDEWAQRTCEPFPGFWMKDIGVFEFAGTRGASTFKLVASALHLPGEARCGRDRAIFLILHGGDGGLKPRHGSAGDLVESKGVGSSVASGDVAPSDSVSHVMARLMA